MINREKLGLFEYWILERESVRHKKDMGQPKPWSHDPIFQRYHFCNVRREDDRGTKERRAVVRKFELMMDELPRAYVASNLFNYAPSLEIFLDSWINRNDTWIDTLKQIRVQGGKVFHVAYVVSTNGESMDKIDYVARLLAQVDGPMVPSLSCRFAFEHLRGIRGLGSFLAGQVIADLKNDRFLSEAPDWHTFSVMGPGSKKGLDLIFGPGTTERTYDERLFELKENLAPSLKNTMHAQDLQNCLCEFSKYHRYINDEDGRRRYYS